MRKLLNLIRNAVSATSAVTRRAGLAAFGAGLAFTWCGLPDATAQTVAQDLIPTTMGLPISSEQNQALQFSDLPTVDATYSAASDKTVTRQASLLSGGRPRARSIGYGRPDPCNPGCDVSWYFGYESLWLKRENDERFSLSNNSFLSDFEFERGGRYTAGYLSDCVNGWEIVYAGPFDWRRTANVAGAANLQSNLVPTVYTAAQIDTFNSADQHFQDYRVQLNSFELNRRWWTWDVLSTMIGLRYVDYEEDYLFFSNRVGTGTGVLIESVDNQLLGAQIGADVLYPFSLRGNVGFRGKAGVYANLDERSTFLRNGGTVLLNAGDEDVDVAGIIEMGVVANYHIVPSIRLTAGYEFWYMPGTATVPEQRPGQISPASGTTVFDDADLFLHGGSVGLQVLF